MPELEFICTECERVLGTLSRDAPVEECDAFCQSLRDQGFTPVHHFGWFCCQACGEAFFQRQSDAFEADKRSKAAEPQPAIPNLSAKSSEASPRSIVATLVRAAAVALKSIRIFVMKICCAGRSPE